MSTDTGGVSPEGLEDYRRKYMERLEVYRRHGFDREKAMRFVIDSAGPVESPVLDIGTGKGFAAVELAKRGLGVTSVDVSSEELEYAMMNAAVEGVESLIDFKTMDANNLPFDDGSFRFVTMINVLHHLEEFGGIIREASRVLAAGGKLLLSDFTAEGFAVLDRIHEEEGRTHHRIAVHGIDDVARMLPEFGLACRSRDTRFEECVMLAEKL